MNRMVWLTVIGGTLGLAGAAGGDQADDVRAALAEAVKPIARRLADPELAVRQEAARELGRLGPAAAPAAGELLHAMKESAMQPAAVEALARIGPAAMAELVGALDDVDPFYRVAVLRAIWELGDPARVGTVLPGQPALFEKLARQLGKGKPDQLRLATAEVIARLAARPDAELGRSAATVIKALVESLADPAKGTQDADARALAAIGRPALPALLTGLADKRMLVRLGSAEALGLIGPEAAAAVPTLLKWLDDEQWRLRLAAAGALGGMGEAAKPAVPRLVQIAWFNKPQGEPSNGGVESAGPFRVSQAAERALVHLGPPAAPAVSVLLEELRDPQSDRRVAAVETLAAIGPAAAPAVPRLLELIRDPGWPVPAVAIEALARTGQPGVAPAIELLGDKDNRLVAAGAELARRLGPAGAPAVDALLARVKADSPQALRVACLEALAAIGPPAARAVQPIAVMIASEKDLDLRNKMFTTLAALGPAAVGTLGELLEAADAALRREAVGALGSMGSAAAPLAAVLVRRLGDEDLTVRMLAAVTLGRVGPPAVAPLLAATRSPDVNTRAGACEALGRTGPAGAESAARLLELLGDRNAQVRSSAAWALGRLGPKALADPAVRESLTRRLTNASESVAVRSAAAESLGEAPDPSADLVRTLAGLRAERALHDTATEALARIGRTVFSPTRP